MTFVLQTINITNTKKTPRFYIINLYLYYVIL